MYTEILNDMGKMILDSIEKDDGQSIPGMVRMFDDDFYDAILGTYLRAGVELGSRIVVEKREVSKELNDAIADEVEILRELTDLQESTIRQIEEKLASDVSAGKTTKEITELIIDSGVFSPMRALRIARTVCGAGASRGQHLSLVMVGATHKVWLTAGDSHVRDAHVKMNGEEVGVNELFSNGARYPVDSRLSAAQRINCRCSMMGRINDMADLTPDALEQTTPWEPAKTIKDAEKWAKDHGVTDVDYSGMTIEFANEINKALRSIPKDAIPNFIGNGAKFKKKSGRNLERKKEQWYGVSVTDYKITGEVFKGIGYNTREYKTLDSITQRKEIMNKKYKEKHGNGWSYNKTGEETIYHEMGHIYDQKNHVSSSDEWTLTINFKWQREEQYDILKSDSEAFAEAFAAFYSGNGDKLPGYVREFMEKLK